MSSQYIARGISNDGIIVGIGTREIIVCWPGAYQEGQDIGPLITGIPPGMSIYAFRIEDFSNGHWIAGWITDNTDGRLKAYALDPQGALHPP
jgi:hypothetical protein